MTDRPILFSGPMVRALLSGAKTQTRRLVRRPHECKDGRGEVGMLVTEPCPYGGAGDRLWVRETWAEMCRQADPRCWCEVQDKKANHYAEYRADLEPGCADRPGQWPADSDDEDAPRWRPSIHMPRWASRLTLEVTGVRVERLRDITSTDAIAEGIQPTANSQTIDCATPSPREAFADLWNSINGERASWTSNPWVWVVEFRRAA